MVLAAHSHTGGKLALYARTHTSLSLFLSTSAAAVVVPRSGDFQTSLLSEVGGTCGRGVVVSILLQHRML
jgi:hypothetical protein